MDAKRKAEMMASLRERLDTATNGLGVVERLAWVINHVEDYLGRWTAFCGLDAIPISGILESDLHTVLLLGVALMDEEIERIGGPSRLRERWEEFAGLVRAIHAETSPQSSVCLTLKVQTNSKPPVFFRV